MKKRPQKPLKVEIITIFPELVEPYLNGSILGRGQKAGLLEFKSHQLRDWTEDKHKTVDDKPFGGGPGMVMKVQPFHNALIALGLRKKDGSSTAKAKKARVIITSAKGALFTQADAKRLCDYDQLVFLCGRYEGIDQRVIDELCDEELRIGDYVLTGGELAAMTMTDAVARLRDGVLGDSASLDVESHTVKGIGEEPQYTRPESYKIKGMKNSWDVPEVLLSGNHANIEKWKTQERKPLD